MKKNTAIEGPHDAEQRRRNIALAIRKLWESLNSHLGYAVRCRERGANEKWHARCCHDYGHGINTLTRELVALTDHQPDKVEPANEEI